ncbi:hypothetical protein CH63R_12140 [Colletotrichum higginsianum IMI 349063]|uniref:Uncharacterized protein n=2 Tax=Colletotrichum higginsianum (strain IMI 349063) TaxID=759273 RepID=A0A1B7Y098_COLHI|nr:hypothetical protein CH63R_12140 [Colletotrichum higginsianum IMI 349063]OBR05437.1 hypothetical protein CH63R_12140 [Colletotrichum higginsianum IMI 349063]
MAAFGASYLSDGRKVLSGPGQFTVLFLSTITNNQWTEWLAFFHSLASPSRLELMESVDDMLHMGRVVEIIEIAPCHTRAQTPYIPAAATPCAGCDGTTNSPIVLRLRPTTAEAKPKSLVSDHPTQGTEVEDPDTEMTDAPALEEGRTGADAEERSDEEEIGYGSEMSGVEYSGRSTSIAQIFEDIIHVSTLMDME